MGDSDVIGALQFGARSVVMKQAASDMLFKSIRTVMAGQYWWTGICMGGSHKIRAPGSRPPAPDPRQPTSVSPRASSRWCRPSWKVSERRHCPEILISEDGEAPPATSSTSQVSNRLELALFRGSPPESALMTQPGYDADQQGRR